MPARFIFPLQAVLDQRRRVEEVKQRAVAELERRRIDVERAIRERQNSIRLARADLRQRLSAERRADVPGLPPTSVPLADVRMQAAASLHMIAAAQASVFELAGVMRRLDAARLELLQAAADRKAVELLKERRYDEWRREQLRREIAELDELTVTRHAHRDLSLGEEAA